jgi:hypothetical protein
MMTVFRFSLNLVVAALLAVLLVSAANGQATRTWVSGVGDDANPCSRTAPCKTFAGAISKTAASGEINCLDPGGFGTLTITKAITIDCGGTLGSVLASSTTGFNIVAGAGDVVTLRNLEINGSGTGIRGIFISSANTVHIEHVNIYDFSTSCIEVNSSTSVSITVDDATLSECGGTAISTNASGSNLIPGVIRNVRIFGGAAGLTAQNGSRLTLRDSTIYFAGVGVMQTGLAGGGAAVNVVNSSISFNSTALQAVATGNISAFGNDFYSNGIIFNPNGGTIYTGGDNSQGSNAAMGVANGGVATKI